MPCIEINTGHFCEEFNFPGREKWDEEGAGEIMKIGGNSFEEFLKVTEGKRVVAFAASIFLEAISANYKELNLKEKIDYIADNDVEKEGQKIQFDGVEKVIWGVKHLLDDNLEEIVILIGTDRYAYEIYEQLTALPTLDAVPCFCLSLMISQRIDDKTFKIRDNLSELKIPKKIHCFWFSGSPKDEMAKKCMESWQRWCPDYEIIQWNCDNYDVTKNAYMYEAFLHHKWAYVTDYARLDVLDKQGGIYLDLDLELVRNLDCLLQNDFFAGFGPLRDVELAAFGCVPNHSLVKEMLKIYNEKEFWSDREPNLLDVQPMIMDRLLEKKGFNINGRYQMINDSALYPRDIFSPRNWFTGEIAITENTFGIHHCAGGWISKKVKDGNEERGKKLQILKEIFGC